MELNEKAVRDLLSDIEREKGEISYFVSTPAAGAIGDVQIIVTPASGAAICETFNLHDGLTAENSRAIREWIEALL